MERNLSITIKVRRDRRVKVEIFDNESSDAISFIVENTNDEEMAKKIGYEILSWCDIELEANNE